MKMNKKQKIQYEKDIKFLEEFAKEREIQREQNMPHILHTYKINNEAISEIGSIIHIRRSWRPLPFGRKLTPIEITKTFEYKQFKKEFPILCELAEKGGDVKRNLEVVK